jgi:hypothetical protein
MPYVEYIYSTCIQKADEVVFLKKQRAPVCKKSAPAKYRAPSTNAATPFLILTAKSSQFGKSGWIWRGQTMVQQEPTFQEDDCTVASVCAQQGTVSSWRTASFLFLDTLVTDEQMLAEWPNTCLHGPLERGKYNA